MVDLDRIEALLDARKPGHSLPQALYTDAEVFAFDMENVYGRSWLMVGFEVEIAKPGSHMAMTIGRSPIVVLRDRAGVVRGFHNSCRHRGAQICPDGRGAGARLTCPYHRWVYELTGELVHAARMPQDFDRAEHSLKPIHVETLAGTLYVCLADDPPPFAPFRDAFAPLLEPHDLLNAKVAYENVLVEKGNWKLAMENARECYHCAGQHPELSETFPVGAAAYFDFGEDPVAAAFDARMAAAGLAVGPVEGDWWQAIRFPLNEGMASMTLDGRHAVKKLMCERGGGDIGSLRWAIEPHGFCHATADHVFMFSAIPVGPEETIVVSKWLVRADAVEGVDYDLESLGALWNATNRQDRDLVENNQRGVNSAGYTPGPYSPEAESLVIRFVDWYCAKARDEIDRRRAMLVAPTSPPPVLCSVAAGAGW